MRPTKVIKNPKENLVSPFKLPTTSVVEVVVWDEHRAKRGDQYHPLARDSSSAKPREAAQASSDRTPDESSRETPYR